MSSFRPCCSEVTAEVALFPEQEPFSSLIVLDYYDGPVAGFLTCQSHEAHYYFSMLGWNSEHTVRAFALAPISKSGFEQSLSLLGGKPDRLVWVPPALSGGPSEEELDELYANGLQAVIDSASNAKCAIAWSTQLSRTISMRGIRLSLANRLCSWFDLENSETAYDWLGYLEVSDTSAFRVASD